MHSQQDSDNTKTEFENDTYHLMKVKKLKKWRWQKVLKLIIQLEQDEIVIGDDIKMEQEDGDTLIWKLMVVFKNK